VSTTERKEEQQGQNLNAVERGVLDSVEKQAQGTAERATARYLKYSLKKGNTLEISQSTPLGPCTENKWTETRKSGPALPKGLLQKETSGRTVGNEQRRYNRERKGRARREEMALGVSYSGSKDRRGSSIPIRAGGRSRKEEESALNQSPPTKKDLGGGGADNFYNNQFKKAKIGEAAYGSFARKEKNNLGPKIAQKVQKGTRTGTSVCKATNWEKTLGNTSGGSAGLEEGRSRPLKNGSTRRPTTYLFEKGKNKIVERGSVRDVTQRSSVAKARNHPKKFTEKGNKREGRGKKRDMCTTGERGCN